MPLDRKGGKLNTLNRSSQSLSSEKIVDLYRKIDWATYRVLWDWPSNIQHGVHFYYFNTVILLLQKPQVLFDWLVSIFVNNIFQKSKNMFMFC